MPELPEVETARRLLVAWTKGGTIVRAHATDGRSVLETPRSFARDLEGRVIEDIERRGKWLRFELDGGTLLFSHLGMTGRWAKRTPDDEAVRWERARLDVRRKGTVVSARYVDARRFGRLLVAREDIPEWHELGPDPLVDGVTAKSLYTSLAKRKRTLKETLLDQTVLAGVGNIHASEALWKAHLHPLLRSNELAEAQAGTLLRGLHWTFERALAEAEKEGDEPRYINDAGGKNPFKVYDREGEPCPRDKTPIERFVLGGRSTYFCKRCQTPPKKKMVRKP